MNLRATKLVNLPIVSLQSSEPIGHIRQPLIQPAMLEVVGFLCHIDGQKSDRLLLAADIRQIAENCLIVDSEDELVPPEDVIRLESVTRHPYRLIGKPVNTTLNRHLGIVQDFNIDPLTLLVHQLVVARISLMPPAYKHHLIHRDQINEVQPKCIVVNDTTQPEPASFPGLGSIPT